MYSGERSVPLGALVWAGGKNKMAALASDWLRHFRLLLWHCWTACNETWQEERSQRPLPSLCFSGRSQKQDGRPGQSVKKVAYCTQLHDMWPFGPLVLNFAATCTTITRCTLECLSGPSVLWFSCLLFLITWRHYLTFCLEWRYFAMLRCYFTSKVINARGWKIRFLGTGKSRDSPIR